MIHGQVASSGTSGGAEAKGDSRFAGAGSNLLARPARDALGNGTDPRQRAAVAPIAGSQSSKSRASRVGAWMM
jgi:hypothetical protein